MSIAIAHTYLENRASLTCIQNQNNVMRWDYNHPVREFWFQFCNFLVRCYVYIVCPSDLSCSDLKLHQTLKVKNIFKQEKIMLQITLNPGLTLKAFEQPGRQVTCWILETSFTSHFTTFWNTGKRVENTIRREVFFVFFYRVVWKYGETPSRQIYLLNQNLNYGKFEEINRQNLCLFR